MADPGAGIVVRHEPAASRFEASIEGDLAVLSYRRVDGRIEFDHTEVPVPFRGRGIAGTLVRAGLDYARAQGLAVVPLCPYVRVWIERHPEYRALLAKP